MTTEDNLSPASDGSPKLPSDEAERIVQILKENGAPHTAIAAAVHDIERGDTLTRVLLRQRFRAGGMSPSQVALAMKLVDEGFTTEEVADAFAAPSLARPSLRARLDELPPSLSEIAAAGMTGEVKVAVAEVVRERGRAVSEQEVENQRADRSNARTALRAGIGALYLAILIMGAALLMLSGNAASLGYAGMVIAATLVVGIVSCGVVTVTRGERGGLRLPGAVSKKLGSSDERYGRSLGPGEDEDEDEDV